MGKQIDRAGLWLKRPLVPPEPVTPEEEPAEEPDGVTVYLTVNVNIMMADDHTVTVS